MIDPQFIARLEEARSQPGIVPPAQPVSPVSAVAGLRERIKQAFADLTQAQDALAEVNRQIAAAQQARATRLQQISEYDTKAQQVATQHIASGHGDVSEEEAALDEQAQKLRREVARADAALAILQQQQAEAAQRVQRASLSAGQAQADLEVAEVRDQAEPLRQRILALIADLRQAIADGREHNRRAAQVIQQRVLVYGRPRLTDLEARSEAAEMLVLPGVDLAALDQLSERTERVPRLADGVVLRFQPDLCHVDADPDLAMRIAAVQ